MLNQTEIKKRFLPTKMKPHHLFNYICFFHISFYMPVINDNLLQISVESYVRFVVVLFNTTMLGYSHLRLLSSLFFEKIYL